MRSRPLLKPAQFPEKPFAEKRGSSSSENYDEFSFWDLHHISRLEICPLPRLAGDEKEQIFYSFKTGLRWMNLDACAKMVKTNGSHLCSWLVEPGVADTSIEMLKGHLKAKLSGRVRFCPCP